ncbi:MAG: DUF2934 domain-containing protein [Phycisphaerae bacterium]|nr:DUF2934 domain-containing protein [Phycisphaerae bacterium]
MAERVNRTTRSTATSSSKAASGATARKTTRASARPQTRQELGISDDQVRNRAYQIFLRRNGAPGDQFGDWVLAERELMTELCSRRSRGSRRGQVQG